MIRPAAPCALAGLLAAIAAPGAAQSLQVTPLPACIEVGATPASFRAYFGYESREGRLVQLAEGADNRMLPAAPGQGPLTLFRPGWREKAFRIEFQPSADSPVLSWVFQGARVDASWESRRCGAVNDADVDRYFRFDDGSE